MTNAVIIELPKIIWADDYHDFNYFSTSVIKPLIKDAKVEELGYDTELRQYVGIVFIGKMPSDSEIDILLKSNNIVLD